MIGAIRIATVLFIAEALGATHAFACSCNFDLGANPKTSDIRAAAAAALDEAEFVAIGTIRAGEPPFVGCDLRGWRLGSGFNPSGEATIEIERSLKGDLRGSIKLKTGGNVEMNEACEAVSYASSCDMDWIDGERNIWVLARAPGGRFVFADKCSALLIRTRLADDSGFSE